jgi:hypothetical protein
MIPVILQGAVLEYLIFKNQLRTAFLINTPPAKTSFNSQAHIVKRASMQPDALFHIQIKAKINGEGKLR